MPDLKNQDEAEVQLLFGDEEKSKTARFAYESSVWERVSLVPCYLTEQHRQDDDRFLELLAAVRGDRFDEEHLEVLATRRITREQMPAGAPKLYSHNVDVDRVNATELEKLSGQRYDFAMTADGPEKLVVALKKGCLSPEELGLKVGAKVMFTKNKPMEGFVNGTLGTVVKIEGAGGGSFGLGLATPVVETRTGKRIRVEPMDWTVEEDGKVRARVSQLPLRLAWAMTVHKSQGVSLDEAIMDLSQVFEYGQGYVALSRVRRLEGLHLLGWNERAFKVHPLVLARDHDFREASTTAERQFAELEAETLATMHSNFVYACGGKVGAKKEKKEKKVASPQVTKQFILEKKSLQEIAAERKLTLGTIVSHLETLREEDKNIDIDYLKKEAFTPARFKKIADAFLATAKSNPERHLGPVKSKLGVAYNYDEIRLVRLFLWGSVAK